MVDRAELTNLIVEFDCEEPRLFGRHRLVLTDAITAGAHAEAGRGGGSGGISLALALKEAPSRLTEGGLSDPKRRLFRVSPRLLAVPEVLPARPLLEAVAATEPIFRFEETIPGQQLVA